MHHGIEPALQECRVDRAEWFEAFRGQSGGEDDGVLFRNSDVDILVGMVSAEPIESRAIRHCRCNRDYLVIAVRQLNQRVGKYLRIRPLPDNLRFTSFGILGAQTMKLLLLLHCRLEPPAFLCQHVQQDGTLLGLEELKRLDQRGDVVAVDRTVVLQSQLLEDDAWPQHALGRFLSLAGEAQRFLTAEALDELAGTLM